MGEQRKRVASQNSILYENEKNIKQLETSIQNWDRVQIHLGPSKEKEGMDFESKMSCLRRRIQEEISEIPVHIDWKKEDIKNLGDEYFNSFKKSPFLFWKRWSL